MNLMNAAPKMFPSRSSSSCLWIVWAIFLSSSSPFLTHHHVGAFALPAFGSSEALYKDSDPVTQLSVLDFSSTVMATSNAWLIEFYSSWCGHCIDFAPTFLKLANDVKGWEKVIKIGVVDCAKDENIPLCREYEVMGYPTLKYFPSFSEQGQLGKAWRGKKDVDVIRKSMIDFVQEQFDEGKASPHWPILTPLNNETVDELWSHYNHDELILLFEEDAEGDEPYWSREAIMDAYQFTPTYPPIRRVRSSSRQDLVDRFKVNSLPALVFLERRSGKAELYSVQPSREFLAKLMMKFFGAGSDPATTSRLIQLAESNDAKAPVETKTAAKDQVYMADLEGAVMYSLGHEVALHKLVAGKELAALKDLIRVLDEYLPGRPALKTVLKTIRTKLVGYKKSIPGQEFAQLWQESLGGQKFSREWVGCKGSRPHLRGYPCSLWTMFHTLTVNYARLRDPDSKDPPGLVLFAMKGYIKYFFGCAHCSNHFIDMAEDETSPMESVQTPDEAILWLWKGHNRVNRRISGDASEDPAFPKIIFPRPQNCPGCNQDEKLALEYLKKIYDEESISSEGMTLSIVASDGRDHHHAESSGASIHRIQISSLSFTSYDVSLYAFIYLASSAILLVVLFRMFIHKRRVRKYVFDVCGQC